MTRSPSPASRTSQGGCSCVHAASTYIFANSFATTSLAIWRGLSFDLLYLLPFDAMAAAATVSAANGMTGMSSGTLHYSRDASSTAQAPSVLPSPHPAITTFAAAHQARAHDDDDDYHDSQSLNEWRRRRSYANGNINIESFAKGEFPEDLAMAGEAELTGLGDGMQHWANKRHLTSGNPRDMNAEEQAGGRYVLPCCFRLRH